MKKLYYTPPSDEIFNEVKEKCEEIWKEVDTDNDEYDYATKKINIIKDIENVGDNFMYMITMFYYINIQKLSEKLSAEAKQAVYERLLSVDNFDYSVWFLN